jgi:hypothetical protein
MTNLTEWLIWLTWQIALNRATNMTDPTRYMFLFIFALSELCSLYPFSTSRFCMRSRFSSRYRERKPCHVLRTLRPTILGKEKILFDLAEWSINIFYQHYNWCNDFSFHHFYHTFQTLSSQKCYKVIECIIVINLTELSSISRLFELLHIPRNHKYTFCNWRYQ